MKQIRSSEEKSRTIRKLALRKTDSATVALNQTREQLVDELEALETCESASIQVRAREGDTTEIPDWSAKVK